MSPPGLSEEAQSLGDKQRQLQKGIENKEKRRVLLGYRLRWAVEIFHKTVKQHLGFVVLSITT